MYTDASVRRLLQLVAACALLVVGALPAMTLACQWACAPRPAAQAHHHEGHHQVAASVIQVATDDTRASLTSTVQRCDHAEADFIAISPILAHLGAPAVTAVSTLFGELLPIAMGAGALITTPSPPGTPPRPLSLRI